MNIALIRFYEELNDFLPQCKRKASYPVQFNDHPSVKHLIEAERVPHTEVDLILINGISVSFTERVRHEDQISVYPVFESFDISPVQKLRPTPLREPRFILDVHLGKLARYLRMLGFDSLYSPGYTDRQLVAFSLREQRAVLTRDRGLLMKRELERGYWIRSGHTTDQIREVVLRFDLASSMHRHSRCSLCNGVLISSEETVAREQYPGHRFFSDTTFFQCSQCHKVYWRGSHCARVDRLIRESTP
jgi:uncharacterized protein with PIN domain